MKNVRTVHNTRYENSHLESDTMNINTHIFEDKWERTRFSLKYWHIPIRPHHIHEDRYLQNENLKTDKTRYAHISSSFRMICYTIFKTNTGFILYPYHCTMQNLPLHQLRLLLIQFVQFCWKTEQPFLQNPYKFV